MPLVIHGYGARILIDGVSSAAAIEAIRATWPSQLSVELVDCCPDADTYLSLRSVDACETQIVRDGAIMARVAPDAALDTLCLQIELAVAVNARAGTFIHAGAVGWRGVAVLVPGTSHSGKSTLITELVRCGADYYSDEYAIVDELGRVHPYARPIRLRVQRAQPALRIGVDPLAAALVVSTSYSATARWAPSVLHGAQAVLPIIDNVIVVKDRPAEALRLAARLATQIVTLQGQRPEATQVAPAILQYLDRVLDRADASARGGERAP